MAVTGMLQVGQVPQGPSMSPSSGQDLAIEALPCGTTAIDLHWAGLAMLARGAGPLCCRLTRLGRSDHRECGVGAKTSIRLASWPWPP